MTPEQITTLGAALEALKAELEASLHRDTDTSDIVDLDQPIGRLSRMDAIQQQRMAQAQKLRLRTRLGQVRQALSTMEGGDYGECRACGEDIGIKRLTVRPEAPFCLSCTESNERRQR